MSISSFHYPNDSYSLHGSEIDDDDDDDENKLIDNILFILF